MDSDDELMIHKFMKEEGNVADYVDMHLTIIACRLQLQEDKLKNAAPKHGGLKFGRRKTNPR
jgi:hypothetical protein